MEELLYAVPPIAWIVWAAVLLAGAPLMAKKRKGIAKTIALIPAVTFLCIAAAAHSLQEDRAFREFSRDVMLGRRFSHQGRPVRVVALDNAKRIVTVAADNGVIPALPYRSLARTAAR